MWLSPTSLHSLLMEWNIAATSFTVYLPETNCTKFALRPFVYAYLTMHAYVGYQKADKQEEVENLIRVSLIVVRNHILHVRR